MQTCIRALVRRVTRHSLSLVFALSLGAVPTTAQETDPAVLLERARYEETIRGDLEAAIGIYRQVVNQHTDRRDVAARALLALAQAYETLGREGARETYRRIVSDYADQVEPARVARTRLADLAPARQPDPLGLELRRLWTASAGLQAGALSPDGRRVLFVDWGGLDDPALRGQADVAFYDVLREGASLVTHLPDQSVEATYPSNPIWSSDGHRIAYAHWDDDWTHQRLHLVRSDGTDNRVLVDNEQFANLRPLDFSSTDDFIVALIQGWDDAYRIGLVSTEDGEVTVLKTGGTHAPHPLSLSPDDRWIVFDQHQDDGSERHDIFVLAVDGSQEFILVEGPAEDHLPYWTPDGDAVVFVSDRSGRPALWSVSVENGRPGGEPRLLRDDMGSAYLLGFTAAGGLAYRTPLWRTDLFTAELDLEKGTSGEPRLLTPDFVGTNMLPAWSPDGERVAFVSRRGSAANEYHLVVRDATTGEERAHSLPFASMGNAETTWSEDGTAVYLESGDPVRERTSYRVNVETGTVDRVARRAFVGRSPQPAFASETQTEQLRSRSIRVAGQNEIFRYEEGDDRLAPEETLVWVRDGVRRFSDGVGRDPQTLTPEGHSHAWHLSPDGTTWAAALSTRPDPMVSDALFLVGLSGEPAREIARTEGGEREIMAIRWTPDGRHLLYAEATAPDGEPLEYWMVDIDGGEPRRLDLELTLPEFSGMRFRPDGGAIAFTREERLQELWLMAGLEW